MALNFLACVVCFPSPTDVGENRLRDQPEECLSVRQGAGTTVLCYSAIPLSQFYLSKAVFKYKVCSPRFIPSPCFIPSPQSVVHSPCFILTKSYDERKMQMFIRHWRSENSLFTA